MCPKHRREDADCQAFRRYYDDAGELKGEQEVGYSKKCSKMFQRYTEPKGNFEVLLSGRKGRCCLVLYKRPGCKERHVVKILKEQKWVAVKRKYWRAYYKVKKKCRR